MEGREGRLSSEFLIEDGNPTGGVQGSMRRAQIDGQVVAMEPEQSPSNDLMCEVD